MLKGERCFGPKCPLERQRKLSRQRGYTHQQRKVSEYGERLREKQKVRHIYGVLERQFRNYFAKAERLPGLVGENLLRMLEMRLDNVIYRLGFADSHSQARQIVCHGHITVNGRKVDIPSYQVKVGDGIAWKEPSKKLELYKQMAEKIESRVVPVWLSMNPENLSGKVVSIPSRDDMDATINEKLIVEYYSK
jgi:small subunit ribosomal protein S4